jgi:ABC-type transport system involved in cytochrome c biogenesis permease subunit
VAGYVKEFIESNGQSPQWFTRLTNLEVLPGVSPPGDWVLAILCNLLVVTAMVFAWFYSGASPRGDLMAGFATGLGLVFGFHSITETARIRQTSTAALWRQVAANSEERRGPRLASRS